MGVDDHLILYWDSNALENSEKGFYVNSFEINFLTSMKIIPFMVQILDKISE